MVECNTMFDSYIFVNVWFLTYEESDPIHGSVWCMLETLLWVNEAGIKMEPTKAKGFFECRMIRSASCCYMWLWLMNTNNCWSLITALLPGWLSYQTYLAELGSKIPSSSIPFLPFFPLVFHHSKSQTCKVNELCEEQFSCSTSDDFIRFSGSTVILLCGMCIILRGPGVFYGQVLQEMTRPFHR